MARPRPLPAPFDAEPFSRRTAIDAGLTDRRLRALDLSAPFHGVRIRADIPMSLQSAVRAYQQRMDREHAFSHATAAMLRDLPLPLRFEVLPLHVSCSTPARAPAGRNVAGHRIRGDLWAVERVGLASGDMPFTAPVVSAPLTWLLMAEVLDVPDLVALGDAMLTRGVTTEAALAVALRQWGAGRAVRRLRAALPLLRRGAESRPETLLRLQICEAGLPEPVVNVPVTDRLGRRLFRPDLSWPDHRVLVEYEGDIHRVSQAKFRSDITRMELYADAGWAGLRAVSDDVFVRPQAFLARLQRRLIERGSRPRELRQVRAARR